MSNIENYNKLRLKIGNIETTIDIKQITFKDLWKNYPNKSIVHIDPDTKKDFFSDHCAINVSESLIKNSVSMKSFTGVKCYGKCPSSKDNKQLHALRAQELADWLKSKTNFFKGCSKINNYTGHDYEDKVSGRTGIIFFKDYWRRENQKERTGDHIDLWNKNELASIGHFWTFVRTTFPNASENFLSMSDLKKSKEVLFWEIL